MAEFAGMVGYYGSADDLKAAIALARRNNLSDYTAYMPFSDRAETDAAEPGDNLVRFTALGGGIFGILLALALTIGTQWDYPLVVGGKSITSWPPFLVICFELMVLFGSFGAFFGFLALSWLPHVVPSEGYSPEFAVDTFGLFVPCSSEGPYALLVEDVLWEAGAEDVRKAFR